MAPFAITENGKKGPVAMMDNHGTLSRVENIDLLETENKQNFDTIEEVISDFLPITTKPADVIALLQ